MKNIRWKKDWKDKNDGETRVSWYLKEKFDKDTLRKIFWNRLLDIITITSNHATDASEWTEKTENPKYCMDDRGGFMKRE